ncbi:hypothetical protein C4D60_Mb11t16380 [Musa balbisiana]|uniref:Uncharacterized protein n=1 Tax=Musa balbisiana TaxID=52838 RepID=A0A4S8J4I6_MUSBA|nr:hypothetical protein C4D60_Mb11t16380 [Musa balbisiana]
MPRNIPGDERGRSSRILFGFRRSVGSAEAARKADFPFKKRTEGRQEPATNRLFSAGSQRRAPLMAPLLIAGWFIGTFIAKVADLGILYVKNQYEYRDVKGKLKQLVKNLRKIQAALFEVDKRRITNPGLEEWLWDLKDSVYAAEDVIDGFEYNLLEDIAKGKNQLFFEEKSKDRAKIKNKFIDTLKLLAFCKEDLNQLDDAIKQFSELVDELGKLLKVVELNVATNKKDDAEIPNWRRTTSPVKPRPLRGRDDEVTKLKMLLKTDDKVNWELLKECSLSDQNHAEHRRLERIGWEISQKLGGSPLAAVTVGRALKYDLKEEHWRRILHKKIYEIEEKEGDIVSVLRLSYEQLPAHLKQCYISCSLFPKNHSFERDDLLQMWMALGFVQANDKHDRMEDIGQDLINELSSRSFFVNAKRKEDKFVIHAVLHELADCISDGEYFRLDDEYEGNQPIRIPDKARHIYVTADNLVMFSKILCKKDNVRSLVVAGDLSHGIPKSDFVDSLKEVLDSFKCLRLLILSVLGSGLPKAIGGLKHLRYLEIPGDVITEWPESFCNLYHLQWVNLKMCSKNLLLPEKMNRLIRLRRLIPSPEAISTIAGVGKLTSLLELKKYHVQLKEGFEALPPFGELPLLKILHIRSLSSIDKIDTTFFGIDKDKICVNPQKEKKENNVSFPALEELLFDDLENWNAWDGLENGFELFPCLHKLFIWNCNNLRGPLPLPSFLRELTILLYPPSPIIFPEDISPTSMFKIYTDNIHLIRDCLEERNPVLLCTLEIHGISVLRSLIDEKDWFFRLNSLKQLVLVNCGTYNPPELQNISFPIIRRASDARKINRPPAEASSKESRTRQRDEDQGWNTQSLSTDEAVHMPTPEKTDIKRSKMAQGAKQDDASN